MKVQQENGVANTLCREALRFDKGKDESVFSRWFGLTENMIVL